MRKETILIVDDDKTVRQMLCDSLSRFDCIEMENGVDGLSYLEKHPGYVDLVIMDFAMPMMDGYEMLQCIQSNQLIKSIPVILIISAEDQEQIRKAFDLGVDDVLMKPFEQNIVLKRVQNMLQIGNSRQFHNVMEDLVRVAIDENIDNLGICSCPICRKDLMTLTLNRVTPKYATSEKGAIISKVGTTVEEKIKILAEVAHTAQQIKEHPRHALSNINS